MIKKVPDQFLVIGADSAIGSNLFNLLNTIGRNVWGTTRRHKEVNERKIFLDLSNDLTDWHSPYSFSVIFVCAGITSIKQCQENPEQSSKINVSNTIQIIKKLVADGSFVVFLSTNDVFDSKKPFRKIEEVVCPITEYGKQKVEVERYLSSLGENASIIRLTKVIHPHTRLFKEWLLKLRGNEQIHPFNNKFFSPIPLSFVTKVLIQIAESKLSGISHISGDKDITYTEAAQYFAHYLKVGAHLIQPIQTEEPTRHTTLDSTMIAKKLNLKFPNVEQALNTMFESKEKSFIS